MFWELFGLVCVLWFVHKYRQRRACTVPGPWSLPLLGNILQLRTNMHRTLTDWQKQYGDVMKIQMSVFPLIIVSSKELIREVLITKSDDYAGRPQLHRFKIVSNGGKGILFQDFSAEYKIHKKIAITSLRLYGDGLHKLEVISKGCIEEFISYIEANKGKAMDYSKVVTTVVVNIITSMVLGKTFPLECSDIADVIDRRAHRSKALANMMMFLFDIFPWLSKYSSLMKTYEEGQRDNTAFIHSHLKALEADFDGETVTCFAESVYKHHLNTKGKNGEDIVSYEDYLSIVRTILIAGFETTSSSLIQLLTILSQMPEIQSKLTEEIHKVVGKTDFPRLEDKDSMPYAEATITELLRFISHLPFGGPHQTTKDVVLAGYKIPKGTAVMSNLWSMHHDERYYKDPWTFQPERWLDDNGVALPVDHPQRQCFAPFGVGRRFCVGETLAKNRLFLFMSAILQSFYILPPEGGPANEYNVCDVPFAFVMKLPDLNIRFVPHSGPGSLADLPDLSIPYYYRTVKKLT